MKASKIGSLVAVILIGVGGTALAVQAFSGNNKVRNPVLDKEPRCDLEVHVAATSAEGQLDKIKIEEQSFRTEISKSGFLLSLTGTDTQGALSLFTAQNVEMTYKLSGPVNREATKQLGDLGAIGKTKATSHTFSKIPEGSYNVDMVLTWEKDQDRYSKSVDVQCSNKGGS